MASVSLIVRVMTDWWRQFSGLNQYNYNRVKEIEMRFIERKLPLLLFLIAGLSIPACSLSERVAVSAVDYNRAIENSNNQQILLNIARASHQMPLYFTRIGSITGNFEVSAGIDAAIPFGPNVTAVNNTNSISPSVSIRSSPNFDIQPLDDKEFVRETLRPLPTEVFAYYWESGWPKQLLLHLFIESAEVWLPKSGGPCFIGNVPKYPDTFSEFDAFVAAFAELRPIVRQIEQKAFGPVLNLSNASDLTGLKHAKEAGFSIGASDKGVQLKKGTGSVAFDGLEPPKGKRSTKIKQLPKCKDGAFKELREIARDAANEAAPKTPDGLAAKLRLRSAQGVIVYLGELVAAMRDRPKDGPRKFANYTSGGSITRTTLFNVGRGSRTEIPPSNALINVVHQNERYWILPSIDDGKTLLAIALVHQLIGGNTDTTGFRPTETVRFIN